MSLTQKQQAFVEAYLSNRGNAALAYRTAYDTNASDQRAAEEGHALLRHPKIAPIIAQADARAADAIERAVEQHAFDQEALAKQLHSWGTTDPRQIFTWSEQGVRLKPSDQISADAAACISEIRQGPNGISIKLVDRHAALMSFAKLRGWLTDRTQQLGADGKPIDPTAPKYILVR